MFLLESKLLLLMSQFRQLLTGLESTLNNSNAQILLLFIIRINYEFQMMKLEKSNDVCTEKKWIFNTHNIVRMQSHRKH